MINVRAPWALVSCVLLLTACTGNDSGGGRIDRTGEFHDISVEGLAYSTDYTQGLTGPNGTFSYRSLHAVTFQIGDILLGSAPPQDYITPLTLIGATRMDQATAQVLNTARLLITLDADCRLSNGIQLTAGTRSAGQSRSLRFDQPDALFGADPAVHAFLNAVDQTGAGRCPQLVTTEVAREHLRRTVEHIAAHGVPNYAPSVSTQGPTSARTGDTVQMQARGSDRDGSIRYEWTQISGPAAALNDAGSATPWFIAPAVASPSQMVWQVIVTDDDGATDRAEFTIRIEPVGTASPQPTPTPVNTATPGVTPNPTATPGSSGQPTPAPSSSPTATPGSSGQPTPTPSSSPTATPDASPTPGNRAPRAESSSFDGSEDTPLEGQLQGSDPDGDSLRFERVGSEPAHGQLSLNDSGFFRYVPADDFNGNDSFQFRVNDGQLNSAAVSVTLRIAAVNDLPTVDAGAPQSVGAGETVLLNGVGSDKEGPVSFAWSQVSGTPVTLQNTDRAQARFTAPAVSEISTLQFRLTVTDNQQASASDETTVEVSPGTAENLPPVADAGDAQTVEEGSEVELDGQSSKDPDGQVVAYNWIQVEDAAPRVAIRDASLAVAHVTVPALTQTTVFSFRLRVTDDDGATGDDTTQITVEPVNLAPVADAGPDRERNEDEAVQLDGSNSSDTDGSITLYQWTQVAGDSVTLDDANAISPTFTAPAVDAAGAVLRFELQVTDNEGASDTDQVEVFVHDRAIGVYRVGAAKRSVTPSQAHIDGISEARVATAPHNQRFNLGGFGIDPTQNFPDPIGAFGDALTAPAEEPVHYNDKGQPEHTWVRAVVLSLTPAEGVDQTVAFLTLDAAGAGNVIQDQLKAAVSASTGIPASNILFGQTHSHAGADLQGLWGGVPQDWIQNTLYKQAVAAVNAAMALRQPVRLAVSQQFNNDYNNYRRPRVQPDADADAHVTLLQAVSLANEQTVAHILQYAAHPTSIDENPRVPHADYILGAVDYLENQGGVALYYNGPIADASGSGSRPGCVSTDGPYGSVRCRGEGIASVVAPASGKRSKLSIPSLPVSLEVQHVEVVLPVTNPLFLAAGLIGSFNRYYDFVGLPTREIPGIGPLVADQLINMPQVAPTAITTVSRISIGGAQGLDIVTIPGEATNTFGEYIRSLSDKPAMMLLGLTHNSFGYILPEEEFSYIDNAGNDGFVLPFTGYEEFVSLGPLTAPLLKLQGYHPLFGINASSQRNIPAYLQACMTDPRDAACILNIQGQRLELTQAALAQQCSAYGGPDAFCSLLNPDTPVRPLCDALGFSEGICGLFGIGSGAPAAGADSGVLVQAAQAQLRGCDPFDASHCLMPFPSDHFTIAAVPGSIQAQGTGRRVNINPLAMPRNSAGKPVDPSEWNRADGYSPGQLITTFVDGLDLAATYGKPANVLGFADSALSLDPASPIVVYEVNEAGGAPLLHRVFVEKDVNQNVLIRNEGGQVIERPVAGKSALLIRPASNFREGKRYIAVLRHLKNTAGEAIPAQSIFAACRDGVSTGMPPLDTRCAQWTTRVLPTLQAAQIARDESLYLAWDFTIGSSLNQIGRLKHMRDTAFSSLGPDCTADQPLCQAPDFTVDAVRDVEQRGAIFRRIEGTLTVPSYMVPVDPSPAEQSSVLAMLRQMEQAFPSEFEDVFGGVDIVLGGSVPPNRLFYNPADQFTFDPDHPDALRYGDGLPDSLGTMTTRFICQLPPQASSQTPARAGIYGHGLLDSRMAITYDGVPELSSEFNYLFCAVDLFGFSQGDLVNVVSSLVDLSNFAVVPDASQQGLLNYLFLARALRSPKGFAAHPAFQKQGLPAFDRSDIFYDGNSQGGIVGGAVLAASKDITRGVLGSLGMNYSTLLRRSVDFDLYSVPLYLSYTDELDRDLLFSLMQMLWDRSENNGYAHHITNNAAFGGPNNIAKLDPQFGDHQVTMWSADVMARTMGIAWDGSSTVRVGQQLGQSPRHPDVVPGLGMPTLDYTNAAQAAGSALVLWDLPGSDTYAQIPPITNTPPAAGIDPHDFSAKQFVGRCQKAHFLQTGGRLIDPKPLQFNAAPCPAVAGAAPVTGTPGDGGVDTSIGIDDLIGQLPADLALAAQRLAAGDMEGALNAVQAGGAEYANHDLALLAQQVGLALGQRLNPPPAKPTPQAHTPQPLRAGVARKAIWIPIGTPLGGYLRPPVGGDYIPGAEAFQEGDPSRFFDELLDFLPTEQDHDGAPIAPLPDELRALHSPYAVWSPPSRGVYDSLVAKSVALYDGLDYIVLVKTDFIGMLDEIVQRVRLQVQARTQIDLGDGLIMSGTHTHDGPGALANHSIRYFWLAMDVFQPALVQGIVDQLADVVVESLGALQPATISHVKPLDEGGFNRYRRGRLPQYDEARMDYEVRKRIGLLRIDAAGGQQGQDPLALIINYSAHGIAFDVENLYFSGDMLGGIERALEGSYSSPVTAMLVQSAGGDISPGAVGFDNKLQRMEAYGLRMAVQLRDISDGARGQNEQTAPDLRAVSQRIILSRERLGYQADEFPFPWGGAQCYNDLGTPFVDVFDTGQKISSCLPGTPPDLVDLLDNGVGENGALLPQDTILTAAKIGDMVLLAQPGEATTQYGLELLDRISALGYDKSDLFIWGTSQDHTGYILPPYEDDWKQGGTEGTTTFWGWKTATRFMDGYAVLVRALRDGQAAPRDEFQVNYGLYESIYDNQPAPPALPSFLPGRALRQPASQLRRFESVQFTWEGGDPVVDAPYVVLQKFEGGSFVAARRRNGQVIDDFFEMHIDYELTTGQHVWNVDFEATKDWPVGQYRFAVTGKASQGVASVYSVQSTPFEVSPSSEIQVSVPVRGDDTVQVRLMYQSRPDNYRVVDPMVDPANAAPVARMTFTARNVQGTANFASPTLTVGTAGLFTANLPNSFGEIGTLSVFDEWGNTGTWMAAGQPAAAESDYGSGLIGLLAEGSANLNPALTALLDSNPETAMQHIQHALDELAAGFQDGAGEFDPTRPGGTGVGLGGELDAVALQALGTARNSAPVIVTGQKLAGWSVPAAYGVAHPYPSGATQSGVILDPVGIGQIRDAHNGQIIYPVAGEVGAQGIVPVNNIAAFRFDAASNSFVEIRVQVDERAPYFLANAGSDFSVYSGTDPELSYVWDNTDPVHTWGFESWKMTAGTCNRAYPSGEAAVPDPVRGLDDDDEIVFMASDAGAVYQGATFPVGWQAVQLVNVIDPLAPQVNRAVYLVIKAGGSSFTVPTGYVKYSRDANADQWIDRSFFADSDPEKLGTSNTGYGANLSGTVCPTGDPSNAQNSNDRFPRDGVTVTTPTYRFKASGRWMLRDLRIRGNSAITNPSAWGSRPDLLDRWKGRAFQQSPDSVVSLVGFEDEQVNWEANSSLIGERCGPVRCLREVWGADSGTNVTKTESFYRDVISYQYRVRVHPIPSDGLYTSWDYNRAAMVPTAQEASLGIEGGRFYTLFRPQGVPVDGVNDELGNVDGYAPVPLAECVGNDGPQGPASNGRCPAFFDAADPTFNAPLAFNNWEQVSGKGDSGSLVYSFELVGLTSLANPVVVPYYRDDACLDDGTGDDPVVRPWPGESYDWNGGKVRAAYNASAGRALDYSGTVFGDCLLRQGAHASHGVHYFVTHDSDNAFTPFQTTEIDARQWQYLVPTGRPQNIGEPYANNVRAPLQVVAVPMTPPPVLSGLPF